MDRMVDGYTTCGDVTIVVMHLSTTSDPDRGHVIGVEIDL